MANYYQLEQESYVNGDNQPWKSYNEEIEEIVIEDGVTSIGYFAFYGCTAVESVTIANSVYWISDHAFAECSSLTSLTMPGRYYDEVNYLYPYELIGSSSFENCDNLTTLTLTGTGTDTDPYVLDSYNPLYSAAFNGLESLNLVIGDGITSIGDDGAFGNYDYIKTVTIGDNVSSIGEGAFSDCDGLTSVTIGSGVTSIGDNAFSGCTALESVIIPNNVETIGDYAFNACDVLTSVTIGSGVTTIGDGSFSGCIALESVTIPNNVETIGDNAFESCIALESVTIGSGVTSIGEYAFSCCTSLGSVTIPDNVESIGEYAFSGCTSLESVTINCENTGNYAFYDCTGLTTLNIGSGVTTIGDGSFSGCTALESVIIPDNVETIGDNAFGSCTSLSSVTMPCNINIGDAGGTYFFADCSALTTLTLTGTGSDDIGTTNPLTIGGLSCAQLTLIIGDGIASIGGNAFSFCDFLQSVTIGDDVTSIGENAFSCCTALESVTIPDNVETIGDNAFGGCSGLTTVIIGSGVTSIGEYAFSGCTVLGSVTIPDNVESIGEYAFSGCTSLESVTINCETIGDNAFDSCSDLTSVTIGSDVTTIGSYAFSSCTGLTSLFIPDNVETIGDHAFVSCSGLTTVIIGSGVTNIGADAFYDCTSVTDVYCYADPDLTWDDAGHDDFIRDTDNSNYPTKCYVKKADLPTFGSNWSKGEDTDVNVEFVASTFKIDVSALNPNTSAPETVILGSGVEELVYTKTFKECYNELTGSNPPSAYSVTDVALTSGTNVTVGALNGWDTEFSVWGTGTSVVTVTANDGALTIPFTFNVVESIALSEEDGITADDVENLQGKFAVFNREFSSGVVSTLCLPFPMTSISGGTLYEFADVNYEDGAWVADFTQSVAPTEDSPTDAGAPYLFMTDADGAVTLSGIVPEEFDVTLSGIEANHTGGGTWTFQGTYTPLVYSADGDKDLAGDVYGFAASEYEGDSYTVSPGDFVKAIDGATVAPFRCYLTYDDGNGGTSLARGVTGATNGLPSRIIVRLIGLDGQTTAIGTMDTRTGEVRLSDEWYSLDGRKLEGQPTKEGIYINKGKKLRVKN